MAVSNEKSTDLSPPNNGNAPANRLDNSGGDVDVENGKNRFGHSTNDKAIGGRISGVLPHLQNYDFGSDDSGSDILSKQIELEAGNAIQYRTCSWQKVRASMFMCAK
jgi:hypothetical protein